MDKMREEFEGWANKYNLSITDDGYYVDKVVQRMWQAWQASRAALVVELPGEWDTSYEEAWVMDAASVKEELDKLGIRYE